MASTEKSFLRGSIPDALKASSFSSQNFLLASVES